MIKIAISLIFGVYPLLVSAHAGDHSSIYGREQLLHWLGSGYHLAGFGLLAAGAALLLGLGRQYQAARIISATLAIGGVVLALSS